MRPLFVCWTLGLLGLWQGQARALDFHVAPPPLGSDENPGTRELPFATVARARDTVRAHLATMAESISVWLRGGIYPIDEPLAFNDTDSGTGGHDVIYRAFEGERPVISGGREISGWVLHDDDRGIWKAPARGLRFRQLYVNGWRATRARTPDMGDESDMGPYYRVVRYDQPPGGTEPQIVVDVDEVARWKDLGHVELVLNQDWSQFRLRLDSYVTDESQGTARVRLRSPERHQAFSGSIPPRRSGDPYYFENAYELLDAEGEWHLDPGGDTVYYKPRAGEDLGEARVVAPAVEVLLSLRGIHEEIRHIRFEGITFEHTTWLAPDDEGFVDSQATLGQQGQPLRGAVEITYANHIRLDRCVVRHAGGQGIVFRGLTHDNAVVGCVVTDISGSGIVLRDDGSTGDRVAHSFVSRCGRDYRSAVGIAAQYVAACTLEHNEVWDLPYSGISLGWGWTHEETRLRDNLVWANDIHHVCQLLTDGGGIYTLSRQPGTRLLENYVHDIERSLWGMGAPVNGIFFDNGSSLIVSESTVYENIAQGGTRTNDASFTVVRTGISDQEVKDQAGPRPPYAEMRARVDEETVVPTLVGQTGTGAPGAASGLRLGACYPNPFNSTVVIPYVVPRSEVEHGTRAAARAPRVSLRIYDVAGQRVRTLVDDALHPGSHEMRWDGTDDRGVPVGGGVYVVRLQAGPSLQTGKMLLVR